MQQLERGRLWVLQKVLEVNIVGEVKIVLHSHLHLLLIHLLLMRGKQWTHHKDTSQPSMPFIAEDWNVTLFGSCSNGGGTKRACNSWCQGMHNICCVQSLRMVVKWLEFAMSKQDVKLQQLQVVPPVVPDKPRWVCLHLSGTGISMLRA